MPLSVHLWDNPRDPSREGVQSDCEALTVVPSTSWGTLSLIR